MRLVEPMTDYSWRVASFSEAGQEYTVWRNGRGEFHCTCPHHQYRKQECQHIVAVKGLASGNIKIVIKRKRGETVQIGQHICLRFVGMQNRQAVLELQAPPDVLILRGEVACRVLPQKEEESDE